MGVLYSDYSDRKANSPLCSEFAFSVVAGVGRESALGTIGVMVLN
jgi:hypothetical protein